MLRERATAGTDTYVWTSYERDSNRPRPNWPQNRRTRTQSRRLPQRSHQLNTDIRPITTHTQEHVTSESPVLQTNSQPLISQTIETTEISRNNIKHWCFLLPIYLKCAICVAIVSTFLILRLYYADVLNGFPVLILFSATLMLIIVTLTFVFLRLRKIHLMRQYDQQVDSIEPLAQPIINIQTETFDTQSVAESDSPPPYAVALYLPERIVSNSPPPSYDQIKVV